MIKYFLTIISVSLIILFACNSNRNVLKIEKSMICGKENAATDTVYPDFITASRNLDISYLNRIAANEEQRKYANAIQFLIKRQTGSSEAILLELAMNASNTSIRNESKVLLQNLYLMESRWMEVLKIHPEPENSTDIYFSHSKAWSAGAQAKYIFPEQGITTPLTFTRNGQPLLHVSINGKSFWFIIDTGAQFSVISRKVAQMCGITPIPVQGIDYKSMFSTPGILSRITIENAAIENIPVMIIDSKNLDIRLFGLFTLMKIDGIIGWPQLKNLKLEFDRFQNILKITKSEMTSNKEGNFFFYYKPTVKAAASNGIPLFFFLDTGKGYTSLFSRGEKKLNTEVTEKGLSVSSMMTPMEGTAIQRIMVLKDTGFCISNQFVMFNEIQIEKKENPFFDGWMGMDICKSNIIIDYPKGEFQIINP